MKRSKFQMKKYNNEIMIKIKIIIKSINTN